MAGEDDDIIDNGGGDVADIGAPELPQPDPPIESEPPPKLSVRESIAAALKEHSGKVEPDKTPKPDKPPAKGAAAPGPKAGEKVPAPADKGTPKPGDAPAGPPVSWSAEEKTLWAQLPPAVQAAVQRRETEMSKGVDKIRTQHQELDNAVKPYDETIRRFGFTRGQAVDQLFKWQMALAGPQKVEAFRQLMRSHGVDPATVAGVTSQVAPNGAPSNGIPPELNTVLTGIVNRLGQLDQDRATQTQSAAQQTVMQWAKDKPHFEKVRALMGQLIQSGAVPNLESGHPDLDGAYERAIYADPEVRALVLAEQSAKKAADNAAAIAAKRRAGTSMRVGSPGGLQANSGGKRDVRNETVRDSIKRALDEVRH